MSYIIYIQHTLYYKADKMSIVITVTTELLLEVFVPHLASAT